LGIRVPPGAPLFRDSPSEPCLLRATEVKSLGDPLKKNHNRAFGMPDEVTIEPRVEKHGVRIKVIVPMTPRIHIEVFHLYGENAVNELRAALKAVEEVKNAKQTWES
jgi:hypothetical protein